jgi:preprotein translocase subunit SecY
MALVQIFVCLGGDLLTRNLTLPFAIDGVWLIIVVTVITSAMRNLRPTA